MLGPELDLHTIFGKKIGCSILVRVHMAKWQMHIIQLNQHSQEHRLWAFAVGDRDVYCMRDPAADYTISLLTSLFTLANVVSQY